MESSKNTQWLIVIISILSIVILVGWYFFLVGVGDPDWSSKLVLDLIPNIIATLVAIPVVYFLFTRHGISLDTREGANTQDDKPTEQKKTKLNILENYDDKFKTAQNRIRSATPSHHVLSEKTYKSTKLLILNEEIQKCSSEVIVSSDDSRLQAKGGVAKAIIDNAGRGVLDELIHHRNFSHEQGNIVITSSGDLLARAIFHPIVISIEQNSLPNVNTIEKIIGNSFAAAHSLGAKSIAFPVLGGGTGVTDNFTAWDILILVKKYSIHRLIDV